ncbi:MAG: RluA family pseudouridine synthase [Defluviitaleaceae bacterium]|nr:RluA family pseudouridine synthase [Defluviitaleaceae bacterium]
MSHYTVCAEEEGIRLDAYLSKKNPSLSRSAFQRIIDQNSATVNGKLENKNYRVKKNDEVEWNSIPLVPCETVPEDIPLEILYEDFFLLVINKPRGMVVHPAHGHSNGTLVNALLHRCGSGLSGINGVMRPGIVHRLDKETSGLMVVAKNDNAHIFLAEQLAKREMTRIYHALVTGNIKADSFSINIPVGRHGSDRKKMAALPAGSGKNAETHIKVLHRFDKYTYIEARLITGRTHQIRVHMSSRGNPVVGDELYGGINCQAAKNGQLLHSKIISFTHPETKTEMTFDSELPKYFYEILNTIK